MREIDFIPDWYRAKRRRRRNLLFRASTLTILAMAMTVALVGRFSQTASARAELASLETSFATQADVLAALSELESSVVRIDHKRKLLADLGGGAPLHGVLAEISSLMPQAVTLSEFRITQPDRVADRKVEVGQTATKKDQTGNIEITGWAASDVNVGSLMTNLGRSPLFDSVVLRYSRPVEVNGRVAREFRLDCRLPQFE